MFIKINDKKYDLLFYEESIEDINGEMTNPEIMQILYLQMEINYNDNLVELRNIIKNQMNLIYFIIVLMIICIIAMIINLQE